MYWLNSPESFKMFKKYKHQLVKIILNKKLKLVFLFLFALSFLLSASPAHAILGVGDVGIFDIAQVQLDALDFVDSTVLQYFMFLIILILESIVFVSLSASLLQWSIDLPINLTNEVVLQGWNFVAGISNAFLVLILVFIALTYILKLETFEAKKALPKFILIALLINFSKVFVGAFVDIAEIFQNTISTALGGDFVTLAMEPLIQSSLNILGWFTGIIVSYAGAALIPYVNIAALGVLVILFVTGSLLEIIMKAILLIIFNFVAGSIFFSFTGLFLMRIAMIWILTLFAPLAFVAAVLKTTKKHWDKWLHMLTEWSFLGIVVLFLLGLGLKLFGVIVTEPTNPFQMNALGGTFILPRFIYYYLFLLVYLGVVFYLSKQNMPAFAQALISQATTLVKKGGGAMAGPMKKWAAGGPTETMTKADEWLQRRPRALQALARPFTQPASTALLRHRARVMEEEVKIPTEFDKMSPDDQARYIQAQTTTQRRVALAAKMGGKLHKVEDEKLREGVEKKLEKDAQSLVGDKYHKKHVENLIKALPGMMTEGIYVGLAKDKDKAKEEVKKMKEEIKTQLSQLSADELVLEVALHHKEITKEDIESDRAKAVQKAQTYVRENPDSPDKFLRNTAAATIHLRKASPADIEKIDDPSSLAVRLASHSWSSKGWQKFTDKFSGGAVKDLMERTGGLNATVKNEDDFDKFCRENPRLCSWLATNPVGKTLNFEGLKHMTDLQGSPTTRFEDYRAKMRIREMSQTDPKLIGLERHIRKAEKEQRRMKELRKRGDPRAERHRETMEKHIERGVEVKRQITDNPRLHAISEKIKQAKESEEKRLRKRKGEEEP